MFSRTVSSVSKSVSKAVAPIAKYVPPSIKKAISNYNPVTLAKNFDTRMKNLSVDSIVRDLNGHYSNYNTIKNAVSDPVGLLKTVGTNALNDAKKNIGSTAQKALTSGLPSVSSGGSSPVSVRASINTAQKKMIWEKIITKYVKRKV